MKLSQGGAVLACVKLSTQNHRSVPRLVPRCCMNTGSARKTVPLCFQTATAACHCCDHRPPPGDGARPSLKVTLQGVTVHLASVLADCVSQHA
jgi:hypothetical protein